MKARVKTVKKLSTVSSPAVRRRSALLLSVVLCSVMSAARAGSSVDTLVWKSGYQANQAAAHCGIYWPDQRPFTVPRTVMVDNSVPNGTVIHSWSYADFLPNFSMSCSPITANNIYGYYSAGSGLPSPYVKTFFEVINNYNRLLRVNGQLVPVELRLYLHRTSYPPCVYGGVACAMPGVQYLLGGSTGFNPLSSGEVAIPNQNNFTGRIQFSPARFIGPPAPLNGFIFLSGSVQYSIRADLVKVGNMTPTQYGTATSSTIFRFNDDIYERSYWAATLDGTGLKLVPPSCRLKTQNYAIAMGLWDADTPVHTGLPAEGPSVPVNLQLECNGAVNHVQFSFQDTGSSPLSTGRVSLYDSSNHKVDGVSIALCYQGNTVPVDGVTKIDAGAFGHYVDGSGAFNSGGVAGFDARYVQDQMDITKGGVRYSGPVTGKVNMFVTYY